MILNLKRLNKFVDYKHFKMESLQNVLELIRPVVSIPSIDLKDAFYLVPGTETTEPIWLTLKSNAWNLYVCQMDMDQQWKYFQRFQNTIFYP